MSVMERCSDGRRAKVTFLRSHPSYRALVAALPVDAPRSGIGAIGHSEPGFSAYGADVLTTYHRADHAPGGRRAFAQLLREWGVPLVAGRGYACAYAWKYLGGVRVRTLKVYTDEPAPFALPARQQIALGRWYGPGAPADLEVYFTADEAALQAWATPRGLWVPPLPAGHATYLYSLRVPSTGTGPGILKRYARPDAGQGEFDVETHTRAGWYGHELLAALAGEEDTHGHSRRDADGGAGDEVHAAGHHEGRSAAGGD